MKTLIKNGLLIDPKNKINSILNLLVEDGKIALVTLDEPEADRIIDAEGKIVCPGFIDIHMHEDGERVNKDDNRHPIMKTMLRQGVTTGIGGNCGDNLIDAGEYLDFMDEGQAINMGQFVGLRHYREKAGHLDKYTPVSEEELKLELEYMSADLDKGALGVSFGVRYTPGCEINELTATAKLAAERGKILAAHIRDDAAYVFDSITEFVELGKTVGAPCEISHIGSMGGFGQMKKVLAMTDAYRAEGQKVMMDCYPYFAFSTGIGETTYDDGWMERYDCSYDVIEICDGPFKGTRCDKELFEKLRKEAPETGTIAYVMKPEDVETALLHPAVMIGSDGVLSDGDGHPRACGAFPHFFNMMTKSGKLSIYGAIEKMTSMQADMLGLDNKGCLSKGADADILIFDPDSFADHATFEEPSLFSTGLSYVIIAGEIAVKDDVIINDRLGKAVRKF